ncbi:hypothetical protein [Nocardiopsis sp. CNT312]|uniref:hypothetical protein n=1 Tax=Nocardiopsis sp. CNT312 TaxID=1137268 RepID=UPI00049082BA|nr:hypothetical protein [Nocardiopsis sp. CNT312]
MNRITAYLYTRIQDRLRLTRDDGGYSTETIVVIAGLIAVALAVSAILLDVIVGEAEEIENAFNG